MKLLLQYTKYLSIAKIKNFIHIYLKYVSLHLGFNPINKTMPAFLSIEPASFCNLNCLECPTGQKSTTRTQAFINPLLFQSAVDETSKFLCEILFYFQGEPFLNKNIFSLIEYAHSKRIFTSTSTNAQLIDEAVAEKIVQSKLDHIIISIDGTTQETYEKYRRGGRLDKAVESVALISRKKKELHSKTPFVEIQFLAFHHNEHQITDIKKQGILWGANRVSIKTAQIYDVNKKRELLPTEKRYRRYVLKNGTWEPKKSCKNKCLRVLKGSVLNTEGDILPCCFDKFSAHPFGRIPKTTFFEIWNGKEAQKFRKAVFSNRKNITICRNCTE